MPTSVKYFHSAISGAPSLSGTAGTLISLLDSCLVSGFGQKTVDSLVIANGVATANISTGHSFEQDAVVLIAGATPAGLNGEKTVLSTTTTSVTFDATGISNQTASGSITMRWAPAGWEKVFSGTNLAVYRSADVTSTRMLIRVDDTGTTNARVVGYESMTDVNTGIGPFPNATQLAGGAYYPKSSTADAVARSWTVIADAKTFHLHVATAVNTGASGGVVGFGDMEPFRQGDAYAAYLCGSNLSTSATSASGWTGGLEHGASTTGMWVPRSYTGLSGALAAGHCADFYHAGGFFGAGNAVFAPGGYPNRANNGLFLGRAAIYEPAITARGRIRGLRAPMQDCQDLFSWRDKLSGQGDALGRKLLAIRCGAFASTASQALVFFDITGPWE